MEIRLLFNNKWWLAAGVICLLVGCRPSYHEADSKVDEYPHLRPDYTDVTFPVNIAPANFSIEEEGDAYQAVFSCKGERKFVCGGKSRKIHIPTDDWRKLLSESVGGSFRIEISVRKSGRWVAYREVTDSVSCDSIDPYLVYRLLYPGYELWNEIGIYQRNLSNYTETPILENRKFGKRQCVNCHSFAGNSPQTMMVHMRGENGGTLIHADGKTEKIKSVPQGAAQGATYACWHPSGNYIAFSMNEVRQFFHSSGKKAIEVSDLASDLCVYDVRRHVMLTDSLLFGEQAMETFPGWSADGKELYFCRGNAFRMGMPLDSIRYDLYRVAFDAEKGVFGRMECVYDAASQHKSVSHPRVSPDGRYLMFVLSDYGNFSIWHPESDLYLMDLQTGQTRALTEVNSADVESWHAWSSSGRWFVFSSKRMDGLWARPYFSHFNPVTGMASKPFPLPQEDPEFYGEFLMTYNLPQLLNAPVDFQSDLLEGIHKQAVNTQLEVR